MIFFRDPVKYPIPARGVGIVSLCGYYGQSWQPGVLCITFCLDLRKILHQPRPRPQDPRRVKPHNQDPPVHSLGLEGVGPSRKLFFVMLFVLIQFVGITGNS